MLGVADIYVPEVLQAFNMALWPVAKVVLFLAVLVYPWPKEAPMRMLQFGLGVLALDAIFSIFIFAGVAGVFEWWGQGSWPVLEGVGSVATTGGLLFSIAGAWRLASFVAVLWGKGVSR